MKAPNQVALTKKLLTAEAQRTTEMLRGKVVKTIRRHRPGEMGIEFTIGALYAFLAVYIFLFTAMVIRDGTYTWIYLSTSAVLALLAGIHLFYAPSKKIAAEGQPLR